MTIERIESVGDERAAPYRALNDADLLARDGLFVAEGRLVVQRIIEDGRCELQSLLLNEAALRDLAPFIRDLPASTPVFVCRTADFLALTGFNIHRGCLALVRRPRPLSPAELLADATRVVALDSVANADNVGGVFRNAAAFRADAVLLSRTSCDPLYRKAIRTSMAATLRVPFARMTDAEWSTVVNVLQAAGFAVVALTPRQPSEPLEQFAARPRPNKVALVVGSEGSGLRPEIESAADYRVSIPIAARVDSLNVAVAAGIALYELTASRR